MSNSMKEQFRNNTGILSTENLMMIEKHKGIIIGVGGLGGNVANNLVRLGIGELLLIDFDVFERSNLNRQLFSNQTNIGSSKVVIVKEKLLEINPNCTINILNQKIEEVSIDTLDKYDFMIDAVDTPQTKILISDIAAKLNIPLLHGSCAGWYGQIGWILPGCKLIHDTYGSDKHGLEKELLNPSFTPSIIAGVMCSEYAKFIKNDEDTVINQFVLIDVLTNAILKTGKKHG